MPWAEDRDLGDRPRKLVVPAILQYLQPPIASETADNANSTLERLLAHCPDVWEAIKHQAEPESLMFALSGTSRHLHTFVRTETTSLVLVSLVLVQLSCQHVVATASCLEPPVATGRAPLAKQRISRVVSTAIPDPPVHQRQQDPGYLPFPMQDAFTTQLEARG